MKLRNKKTGEIFDALVREKGGGGSYSLIVCDIKAYEQSKSTLDQTHFVLDEYETLAKLNEEWEDYKPTEPLIKDEKIRKAVRAFSEAIQEKKHILVIKECGLGRAEFSNGANYWIRLPLDVETMDALEDRTYYTIAELCGEEE